MRFMNRILILGFLPFLITLSLKGQDTLSLDDAIQIGLKNNFSIIIARNDLQIATNNNSYGNAGMLPKLDASIGQKNDFMKNSQTPAGGIMESSNRNTSNQNGAVQLSWTLFDGTNMFILKKQYGNLQQMGDFKLRMAIEDATSAIIITYYSIALQQKLLKSQLESLNLSKNRLMIAEEKAKIGAGYELQVLQAEIDFQTDSSTILRQENLIRNHKISLNRLLGRDVNTIFTIKEIQPVFTIPDFKSIAEGLNNQNAELLYERLNVANKELSVKSQKSGRYPRLTLSSDYRFTQSSYSSGQWDFTRNLGPSVGLTASITLFNGFNLSRTIKNAEIQAENQRVLFQQTENILQSNLSQSYNDFMLAIALLKTEEITMSLASKNAIVALEKFRLGAISDLELRDIQKKLLDVQYRYYSALLQAKTAEIDLKILSGLLLNEINISTK